MLRRLGHTPAMDAPGPRDVRGAALLTAALTLALLWDHALAQNPDEKIFYNVVPPGRLYPVGWEELQQEYRQSAPTDKKTHA